jgi:hypothetical protein
MRPRARSARSALLRLFGPRLTREEVEHLVDLIDWAEGGTDLSWQQECARHKFVVFLRRTA